MNKVLITIAILILGACEKSDSPMSNRNPGTIGGRVLEFKSNITIAEATVTLEKCSVPYIFVCQSFEVAGSTTSDAQGSFQFNVSNVSEEFHFTAAHSRYWIGFTNYQRGFSPNGNVLLIPKAWARIHLKRVNNYPQDYQFHIQRFDTDIDSLPVCFDELPTFSNFTFPIPLDTVVLIKCYGSFHNQIRWNLINDSGTPVGDNRLPPFYLNRFDTADLDISF